MKALQEMETKPLIIECLATVKKVEKEKGNLNLSLESSITKELKIDQSLCHNGVCLTVVDIKDDVYTVTVIEESLNRSNLGKLIPDTLKSLAEIDSSKILKVIKPDTVSLKPVKDLTVKILPKEEIKIIKEENTKKSVLSGLRLSGNLGKSLSKGVSLSSHSSYVEPSFFIRFPYGINIGPKPKFQLNVLMLLSK